MGMFSAIAYEHAGRRVKSVVEELRNQPNLTVEEVLERFEELGNYFMSEE